MSDMSEITRDDAGPLPTGAIPVRTPAVGDLETVARVDAALHDSRFETSPVAEPDKLESPAEG